MTDESAPARRLGAARAAAAELELDAILITQLANVRYLTGFTGSNGWLFLSPDRALFATDGRYGEQAQTQLAPDVGFELLVLKDGLLTAVTETIAATHSHQAVGFESPHVSHSLWKKLQEQAASVRWTPVAGLVENLRMCKDPQELAAMEKAATIAVKALAETLALVRPGLCEIEIAAELDYRMARLGSQGQAFDTIVASGPNSALPHAEPGARKLQEGDFLLIDFGARWDGYCCDITRTFALGEPSQQQLAMYDAVLAAQLAAVKVVRAGVSAADVDAAARKVLDAAEVEGEFNHSTGHGLGLEVHEGPRLYGNSEETLRAGMVVTVEPGLYLQGWGGVRIEDDVVVSEGEPRCLVGLPKDKLQSIAVT